MAAKIIIAILLITIITSGSLLAIQATNSTASFDISKFTSQAQQFFQDLDSPTPTPTPRTRRPTSEPSSTPRATGTPTPTSNQKPNSNSRSETTVTINGETIYHNQSENGSSFQAIITISPQNTSHQPSCLSTFAIPDRPTYCYSPEDFTEIRKHYYDYSSAKTFYEFHLESANDYQQEYQETGSDIYLDAKASQESQAQQQKIKMDTAYAAMLAIESRGTPL